MALVKVVSLGGDVKVVPESFFNSYLKDKGYSVYENVQVKNWQSPNMNEEDDNFESEPEGEETDGNEEDVESIPIAEMSAKQLRKYAEIKGIDVSGVKSTKEARDIIRKWKVENGE